MDSLLMDMVVDGGGNLIMQNHRAEESGLWMEALIEILGLLTA
jgi:hypothetical protein